MNELDIYALPSEATNDMHTPMSFRAEDQGLNGKKLIDNLLDDFQNEFLWLCQCTSTILIMIQFICVIYYDLKSSFLIHVIYSLSVLLTIQFLLPVQPQLCFLSLVFPFAFNFVCEIT